MALLSEDTPFLVALKGNQKEMNFLFLLLFWEGGPSTQVGGSCGQQVYLKRTANATPD